MTEYDTQPIGDQYEQLVAEYDALRMHCNDVTTQRDRAVALLREWMATPYFETHADWQAWVQGFGPRVKALLAAAPEVKP